METANLTFFSVILPSIGRASLPRAIDSVLQQDHKDFRLYIGLDGFSDFETKELYLSKNNITMECLLGKHDPDFGAACRNRLINFAESGWITYIDDDDIWLPNHLSIINSIIESNDVDMVRTAGQSFSMKHKHPRSSQLKMKLGPINSTDILTVGMAHTKNHFEKTNGWQPIDNHDHMIWREMLSIGGRAIESDRVTFYFER